jgi:hypothetical protein
MVFKLLEDRILGAWNDFIGSIETTSRVERTSGIPYVPAAGLADQEA